MDQYDAVATQTARLVTNSYSSSFGLATRLFPLSIRADIYNIYGLVRLADEIVDTYLGTDTRQQLDALEAEVYLALKQHYSTNLIVHAFQLTANKYRIGKDLIAPFFYSMRLDTSLQQYTPALYKRYIDGSAEVVGLMCLKVFVDNETEYKHLEPGARALGSAFQKVNFLRDLAADQTELQRFYFPHTSFKTFDDNAKAVIIADIEADFMAAKQAIPQLPVSARAAVSAAYTYYFRLLWKLKVASAKDLLQKRVRINNATKLGLLGKTVIRAKFAKGKS
ncbi:MAG: squalene/phytoene synthase family protein [Patescibacteria group bacterium]|nr:squalene/phytoene synthase family protein [Patescibacteria group bacterium]